MSIHIESTTKICTLAMALNLVSRLRVSCTSAAFWKCDFPMTSHDRMSVGFDIIA